MTKTCPAWLSLSPDRSRFEIIDERADIVRMIFAETAAGVGKGSIASRLNTAGVSAFRGMNGWHASYVQKLLSSDAAVGTYQPHRMENGRRVPIGPPVLNYFPPVVDEALMMRARAAIIARRSGAAGRKGADFRNILNGIAQCAVCQGTMTYVGKGNAERYLVCSSARRRRECPSRILFNFNEAERQFLDAALTFDPDLRNAHGASDTRERLRRAAHAVTRLSGRLTKLLDSFGSDATDEIVAAVALARDHLGVARTDETRLQDLLVTLGRFKLAPEAVTPCLGLRRPTNVDGGWDRGLNRRGDHPRTMTIDLGSSKSKSIGYGRIMRVRRSPDGLPRPWPWSV